MRLAIVVAGLGAGGAERVISLLTRTWVQDGHDITVIAFDSSDDPIYHVFDPAVRLVRLGPVRRRGIAAVAVKVWRLRACLRRLRPDIAVGFLTKINVMLLLATWGSSARVAVAERNNPVRQGAHRGWKQVLDRLYPRADAIILQTEASRECLPASVAGRAVVIPNPLVGQVLDRSGRSPRVVAGVGRLEDQKGFDRLIAAFATIAPKHPDWSLVIWGEGPRRADLAAQIAGLGMTGRITLPGVSARPGGWLDTAGVFALSSRYEGFPNALGEAMAAGLPVVAFDCPYGPADMIESEVDGLLIADHDSSGFGSALDRLLSEERLRINLGAAAKARSVMYNTVHISAHWSNVLHQMIYQT